MTQAARQPRADSVRNRIKIMDAARAQIRAAGPAAGMADIAAAAGVAVGTLYRHFPTKGDLVAAVLREFVVKVADEAERLQAAVEARNQRAGEAVVEFLQFVVEESASNLAVKSVAESVGVEPIDKGEEQRAAVALADLLDQAGREHSLRGDLKVSDVYLLISTAPLGANATTRHRWFDLILKGLQKPTN